MKKTMLLLFSTMFCTILFFVGCVHTSKSIQIASSSQVLKKKFYSRSLAQNMNFNIYLPNGYNKKNKYPVLYLIHGYSDNEDKWMPNLQLNEQADLLIENERIVPLIIVMPQIDNSFGINTDKVMNQSDAFTAGLYEDYLYKDLIPYIDKNYSTIKNKDGRFIGGLSMGGWAALHLAFIHTDMFSKVGGHSPAFIDASWLYPTFDIRTRRDPIKLASEKDLTSLKVYLDCGDKDSFKFYEGCNQLYTILQSNGVTSEYHLNDGEHNDTYWKKNSEKYLLFYAGK